MELMKCPDCGKTISVKARQCPNCGHPFGMGEMINCPACNHTISKRAAMCPNCGHPLQKDNTIRITFPNPGSIQLFNKSCYIYENTGYLIRKCQLGETIDVKSDTDIDVVIKLDVALGKLNIRLEPGGWYQVRVSRFWKRLSIIKSSLKL